MERCLTREECLALLRAHAPKRVADHCEQVARLALTLGRRLNACGCALELDVVEAAALLHDVCRTGSGHAAAGAALLRGMGQARLADIVAEHMELAEASRGRINETTLVYLADKLAGFEGPAALEQRFESSRRRFAGNPEALAAAKRREQDASELRGLIERKTGRPLWTLLEEQAPPVCDSMPQSGKGGRNDESEHLSDPARAAGVPRRR